jgi:DNA (cytosine-5)-methyltransferase 1
MKAIDLFAGAGGFTEGAEMAGCEVIWAGNHWRVAVDIHAANHPNTQHACQDLHQVNWATVPRHDLLLASWCCQGNTHARGKPSNNPEHDASRSTAWAFISAIEHHRPEFFVGENVRGFLNWKLYPAWRMAVEALGYCLDIQMVDAANQGVPQNRDRLFFVGVRAKHPLMLRLPRRAHVPASSFVDFDAGDWSQIEKPGRAAATLARVANGRRQFGDRFVMPYYGKGSGLTGRSLARPIGTITTRDRWAVVDGARMRMLNKDENRAAMGFRPSYILPDDHRLAVHVLGNAVAPQVACDVITALREAA